MQRKKDGTAKQATAAKCGRIVCPASLSLEMRTPERLVGLGFRCWMAGYQTGDISCWEVAWQAYEKILGSRAAEPALGELSSWVRSIRNTSRRQIELYPARCPGFCRDESMAIAMIAACQHSVCPAMRSCAVALLANSDVDDVVKGAESFAHTLRSLDQVLEPLSIGGAGSLFGVAAQQARH